VHPAGAYKSTDGKKGTADPDVGNPFAPRRKSNSASAKARAMTAPDNAERSKSKKKQKHKKSHSQSSRHHRVSNAGTPNELSSGNASARREGSVGTSDRMAKGDGFGRAGVAMFIPLDKPSSRGSSRGSARAERKAAKLANRLSRTPKKEPQAFIPGTGDEKILIKSRGQKLSELPPIRFHKVGSNRDVKSQIEKDKKLARRKYKKARWADKHMKRVLHLPPNARTLILGYAEMQLVKPVQAELVVKGDSGPYSDSSHRESPSVSVAHDTGSSHR